MSTANYKLPTVDPTETLGFIDAVNGLVTATDAVLHSVQEGFDPDDFVLEPATSETLGGVKVGNGFRVYNGTLNRANTAYTLPVATETGLGGIVVGNNIDVTSDGAIGVGVGAYSNANEITEALLANSAITTDKLADSAVTSAKLAVSFDNFQNLWSSANTTSLYIALSYLGAGPYQRFASITKISDNVYYCIPRDGGNGLFYPWSDATTEGTAYAVVDASGSTLTFPALENQSFKIGLQPFDSTTYPNTYTQSGFDIGDIAIDGSGSMTFTRSSQGRSIAGLDRPVGTPIPTFIFLQ